jgi:hypothetical protein
MPLYLDEIYFNVSSKEDYRKVRDLISGAVANQLPPGVTLKGGPWMSNEEPKVLLVLDIQDHSLTFEPWSSVLMTGLASRRRLTPLVEWSAFEKIAK